jgi:hypothetical protein
MYVRVKRTVQNGKTYEYLQLARSYREAGRVRQEVFATLGHRDELVASGELDRLVQSLARFSERLRVEERIRTQGLDACGDRLWGPALVFGRLWEQQGVGEILSELAGERRFSFDAERVTFAMALQRLCRPGSDLQGSRWVGDVEETGFDEVELHHFYRTCRFLYDVREELERRLYHRDRTLFDQELDLVFVDTTSTYVYRKDETRWRKRGYSRDRRGDLPQFVLAVAVDRRSWPIAWQVFPGNTADRKALGKIIETFRNRFQIGRVVVVADRGMFGRPTFRRMEESRKLPYDYIVGCPMRQQKEVSEEVLGRAGRYQVVAENLEVKEVRVKDRRYVVCRNPIEAAKDAKAREALLETLRNTLETRGPKAVVGNKGYARFLKVRSGAVSIDEDAVNAEARLDGKFVLRTSTELPTAEVAESYKSLWRVERTFREQKSTLEVRPIFHHRDDTSIGHIVASFLALRLEVDLQRRLDDLGNKVPWPDLMGDLARVRSIEVDLDGQRYRLRSDLHGHAHAAFRAAGVRPPPRLKHLGDTPEPATAQAQDVVPSP